MILNSIKKIKPHFIGEMFSFFFFNVFFFNTGFYGTRDTYFGQLRTCGFDKENIKETHRISLLCSLWIYILISAFF